MSKFMLKAVVDVLTVLSLATVVLVAPAAAHNDNHRGASGFSCSSRIRGPNTDADPEMS